MLYNNKGGGSHGAHADVNYDMVLRGCNSKLTQWSEHWQHEMQRGKSVTLRAHNLLNLSQRTGPHSISRSSIFFVSTFAFSSIPLGCKNL